MYPYTHRHTNIRSTKGKVFTVKGCYLWCFDRFIYIPYTQATFQLLYETHFLECKIMLGVV